MCLQSNRDLPVNYSSNHCCHGLSWINGSRRVQQFIAESRLKVREKPEDSEECQKVMWTRRYLLESIWCSGAGGEMRRVDNEEKEDRRRGRKEFGDENRGALNMWRQPFRPNRKTSWKTKPANDMLVIKRTEGLTLCWWAAALFTLTLSKQPRSPGVPLSLPLHSLPHRLPLVLQNRSLTVHVCGASVRRSLLPCN